jgi:hypothetical protein
MSHHFMQSNWNVILIYSICIYSNCLHLTNTNNSQRWKLQRSSLVIFFHSFIMSSLLHSVGIALGYGLDSWGSRVRFPEGAGNFSLHHCVHNDSGVHPASYPMGTTGSFPGGKAARHEADHSPPSSAKVKNAWSYTSTPQYVLMAWCLVKHRDNFTFTSYTKMFWTLCTETPSISVPETELCTHLKQGV